MDRREEILAAVQQGDRERIEKQLDADPDLVNECDAEGNSILLIATYSGRREIFELLLHRGAGVNLFEASALGLHDKVAAHIDGDPTVINSYSHDGWTPLHLASFFGQRETAGMLIDRCRGPGCPGVLPPGAVCGDARRPSWCPAGRIARG